MTLTADVPAVTGHDTPARRIVVVGFGMAAARFVDEVLQRTASSAAATPCEVTVVGAEPDPAYNRVLLSDVVAGRADPDALALAAPGSWAERGARVLLGTEVTALDPPGHRVHLSDGTTLPFDVLVLATGAAPVVPRVPGLDPDDPGPGVHALRTLGDARDIVAACGTARHAVVVGGGPLGLEAARGLVRRGVAVEVLQSAPSLLPGVVDPAGSQVLLRTLARLDVPVRTSARAAGIERGPDGAPVAVLTSDGARLPADLVVLACGVRPRTGLAEAAGIGCDRGIVVDELLRTDATDVLAIGDCAEAGGRVSGLVAPAWEQARTAADLVTGTDLRARYRERPGAMRLKAADVEVCGAGDTAADVWDDEPGLSVVQLVDPGAGRYVKVVVRDGTVAGAVVVGDARAGADLAQLVDRGSPAPADPRSLLLPGVAAAPGADDPTRLPDRATVCRCNGVTKGALVKAWESGARGADGLARATRATTGCGSCKDAVSGIAAWLAAADPDPGPDAGPSAPSTTRRNAPAVTGGTR